MFLLCRCQFNLFNLFHQFPAGKGGAGRGWWAGDVVKTAKFIYIYIYQNFLIFLFPNIFSDHKKIYIIQKLIHKLICILGHYLHYIKNEEILNEKLHFFVLFYWNWGCLTANLPIYNMQEPNSIAPSHKWKLVVSNFWTLPELNQGVKKSKIPFLPLLWPSEPQSAQTTTKIDKEVELLNLCNNPYYPFQEVRYVKNDQN